MPLKQFEIIPQNFQQNGTSQLLLEVGNQHIACLVKDNDQKYVAIELFTHTTDEAVDFERVLESAMRESKLLNYSYSSTEVFINNELAILVPSYKFNKDISEDYLRIAFGDDGKFVKGYDAIETDPVIMNVFRIPAQWQNALAERFHFQTVHHVYSCILKSNLRNSLPRETLFVQFYHSHIIASAFKDGKLMIIQSFNYSGPDDILYYLLSLCRQLDLNGPGLSVRVSGMIETDSNLYKELVKYFDDVQPEAINADNVHAPVGDYPAHYFTPICKLAV